MRYGVVDSMLPEPGVEESMLSFRSVWEALSAIVVADSDVESLKCDKCRRFYDSRDGRRRFNA